MIHSGEKQDGGRHTPVSRRNAAFATHTNTNACNLQVHIIFFRQNFRHLRSVNTQKVKKNG